MMKITVGKLKELVRESLDDQRQGADVKCARSYRKCAGCDP